MCCAHSKSQCRMQRHLMHLSWHRKCPKCLFRNLHQALFSRLSPCRPIDAESFRSFGAARCRKPDVVLSRFGIWRLAGRFVRVGGYRPCRRCTPGRILAFPILRSSSCLRLPSQRTLSALPAWENPKGCYPTHLFGNMHVARSLSSRFRWRQSFPVRPELPTRLTSRLHLRRVA